MIVKKYYKLVRVSHEDSEYMRLKNVSNEAGIFKMLKKGNPTAPNLEYSLDGVTWNTYDFTTLPEVTVSAGANIYFRGTNANQKFNTLQDRYFSFNFNKTCEAHGNVCSLFNPDPAVFSAITSVGKCGLTALFYGCTYLTKAQCFSAITSVGDRAMLSIFANTSLNIAPDFSSITSIDESAFGSMFYNCTSLTTGPDLSSITSLGSMALQSMYSGATMISNVTTPNVQDLTQNNVLYRWLDNAGGQATGTKVVRVPTGATIKTDSTSGIPTGWTRVDY